MLNTMDKLWKITLGVCRYVSTEFHTWWYNILVSFPLKYISFPETISLFFIKLIKETKQQTKNKKNKTINEKMTTSQNIVFKLQFLRSFL